MASAGQPALLESSAAEHARMRWTPPPATPGNGGRLTLYMNKVRQAAITREIIEIVGVRGT
jgi:F0F1-type ATP synthase gamma subunit